jgi:8-oxo-dGTP diphosphatase
MNASNYVVGFLFTPDKKSVVLIEKDHPAWQAGRWNGLGGHVEPGETVEQAISREVLEEAGVLVPPEDWTPFLVLEGNEYSATFLRAFSPLALEATTMTSERVLSWQVTTVPHLLTLNSTEWAILLALDTALRVPVQVWNNYIAGKPAAS